MDVIVDGGSEFQLTGEPDTVLDVVNAALLYLRDKRRGIVSLSVDGESLSPEDLRAKHEATPPGDVSRIEIESRPVSDMVRDSLDTLEKTLPELPEACRQLAQVFQGETPEEGFEPFQEFARIWEHVKIQQQAIAAALGLELTEMVLDGRPVQEHLEELNSFLLESAQALQDGDTVLIGDLLEYELAPRAELEARIVAALREAADAA